MMEQEHDEARRIMAEAEQEIIRWATRLIVDGLPLTPGLRRPADVDFVTPQADAVSTYLRAAVEAYEGALEDVQRTCAHATAVPCSSPLPGRTEYYCDACGLTWLR